MTGTETMDMPTVRPPRPRGEDRVHAVIRAIRDEVLSGGFTPNQRLVEADLQKQFGVNRLIIRTAIYVLEHEGLVKREQNRGAWVRRISHVEALEIAAVRTEIEHVVAREAAVRAEPEDIAALRDVFGRMQAAYDAGDLFEMSRLNSRLHEAIHTAAHNATLAAIVANLKHQLVSLQFSTMLMPGRADRSINEHRDLVDAIVARDPDLAGERMRVHMRAVQENLARCLQEFRSR